MLIVGLLVAIAMAASINLVIPKFEYVFQSLDSELPLLTRLFLEGRYALFGLPLIVLAAWTLTPRQTPPGNERGIVALVVGIGISAILLPLCLMAMYWPVVHSADPIGR